MLNYFCRRVLNPDSQHETDNSSFTTRAYRLIMWLVTLQVYQEQFRTISQYYKPSYLAMQLYWPEFIFKTQLIISLDSNKHLYLFTSVDYVTNQLPSCSCLTPQEKLCQEFR